MRHLFLCVLVFFIAVEGFSQCDSTEFRKKNYPIISANFQSGKILPTTDFVRGDNLAGKPMKKYQSYTLKMLWQNPGYSNWQKIYNSPYYGFGITLGNFFNPEETGHPISAYGILGLPVKRWKKLELYSEFQYGLTCNWNYYDPVTNPKNLVIGGGMTVHLDAGLNAFYPINKHLDLGAGVSFKHFSNGGFERPNRGFNIFSPSVEVKYHFNSRPKVRETPKPDRQERSNDLLLMLGYGDHQLVEHELDTNYFAISGISAIYCTQFSNAFRLGYGADFNYWWGLNAGPDGAPNTPTFENLTLGIILQPEIIVGKLTLLSGIGMYVFHRNYGNMKKPYQRLGVRYDFYRNWSLGVNVRAINFMLAEFMEFNLSYKISWAK
uniref:acyloxyacyl hydrolase n=1 Tax=uncultured Draconibacterium sp. TaxID=1573823 RepID=UPI003216E675